MNGKLAAAFLYYLFLSQGASAARILALMIVPSNSHHLWNSKYLEALAARGHHITYFTINEYKNPPKNITHIQVKGFYELLSDVDFASYSDVGPYQNVLNLKGWEEMEAEFMLKSDDVKQLIRVIRKEKFDLVVHDMAVGPFLLGAVDVLGRPPVMGITAYGTPPWALEILGNPISFATNPYFYTSYSDSMTLLQRADNYFLHLFSMAVRWFSMRTQDSISKQLFGKDVRPLDQILDDMNIILVNSYYGINYPLPQVPGLVSIGGLHIQEPKPLPQDLKTFLDGAKEGVIFFSLGSNVRSSMVASKVEALTKAFKQLSPIKVLWKWDEDSVPNKPDNVKLGKWLPQNDILAHPNVRLFFTHSGLLSTQEAVYHGKPIVGMPLLLDQHANVQLCLNRGFGEKLDFKTLTADKVVAAIRRVLDDPRYTENVRKASSIFRDHMESPLDRAVYWTEYAVRHKGAPHLRYSGRNLSWYRNCMLDVIALTFVPLIITWHLLCFIFSGIFIKKTKKIKKN